MSDLLEKLKARKKEIINKKELEYNINININKETKERTAFSRIEEIDNKKIYYTKIFKHLVKFRIANKDNKLSLTFQKLNNKKNYYLFNLFPLKGDNKFLGIKYGWDKLEKPFLLRKDNKSYVIKKLYYLEFKFSKGSVKCYIQSLRTLLRKKEKGNTKYYRFNLEHIKRMENTVYKFYSKKLKDTGGIYKWIEKNQTS
ncbi:DUF226 domain-containing protein [Borreliella burgdorferi]|uniref:DUF226 domain-containing protein n=1 Tax=Borreliella burgdorferi TaxID=139 RepID=UPI000D023776|nr:DUF226 domain-containing protein [Borreliella burgdorferi]MCD2330959.1 DUF226 domain-containing protein [Borreliella burgdorferi]MCD2408637.1 DUF226 domain-containing protein [Borreliella burgdorferi]PRQ93645.1 hypothetical protein CV682_04460 [Borreliella burgdorferi]PRQ95126.1 hypothetical protein CV688_04695 [Borreliella burgdorferi]PRR39375.1 hypothetical protein CV686_04700 [Borreliella burgdorferi]